MRAAANVATVMEDSRANDAFVAIKRVPILGDILNVLIPFTGTAVFGLGMQARAIGFIKLGTGGEDEDKRCGVETTHGGQYGVHV